MAKKKTVRTGRLLNLFRYFVIGLLVAILSYIILLPVSFAMTLIALGGFGIVIAFVMGIYMLFAVTVSGWIIVKVVEFFGWKRVRKLKF